MSAITLDELKEKKKELRAMRKAMESETRARIVVHMGTCGVASGAQKILDRVSQLIDAEGANDIQIMTSGCAGLCSREPMFTVEMGNAPPVKYAELTESKAEKIFKKHVLGGKIVESSLLAVGSEMTR